MGTQRGGDLASRCSVKHRHAPPYSPQRLAGQSLANDGFWARLEAQKHPHSKCFLIIADFSLSLLILYFI